MERDDLSEPIERERTAEIERLVCRDCGHALIWGTDWAGAICSSNPKVATHLSKLRRGTGCGRVYSYAELTSQPERIA